MVDSLLQRASQLMSLKRFAEAEKAIMDVLITDPINPEAISMLAICKSELHNNSEALKLIHQAIGIRPDNDYYLYLASLIHFRNEDLKSAYRFVANAIAYNPNQADYFGLQAMILIGKKEWENALLSANKGLSIDGESLVNLNARSTALLKLNRKGEAFETIRESLYKDPENDATHANIGWGKLEQGNVHEALESFRASLQLNPENQNAKAGLVEALKARYWFYRIFLKYAFWVNNLKAGSQWVLLLGMYFGVKILQGIARLDPILKLLITPIIYLYLAFAFSTWLITPLSNLFLRLNIYGRYALTKNEVVSSNFVGLSLLLAILSLALFWASKSDIFLLSAIYFVFLMLPLGSMLRPTKERARLILLSYTVALALIGLMGLFLIESNTSTLLWTIFIYGTIAYQWLSNFLTINR